MGDIFESNTNLPCYMKLNNYIASNIFFSDFHCILSPASEMTALASVLCRLLKIVYISEYGNSFLHNKTP